VSDAKRLRQLEDENRRLKTMVAVLDDNYTSPPATTTPPHP
jgi:hypothetical protein